MLFIYAFYISCYGAFGDETPSAEFIAIPNKYFNTSSTKLEQLSNIECCTECGHDENCLATNYNRDASGCELLAQKPILREHFEANQNWTMYIKTDIHDRDWSQFNQSLYLVVRVFMDWQHADGHCLGLNAELVDIQSSEEHAFVFDLANVTVVWIGLNDFVEENTFSWSSGSPFTYTAFDEDEPNDKNGTEDCVEMGYSMLWNDIKCYYIRHSICKKYIN